jgi:hypothetical protein
MKNIIRLASILTVLLAAPAHALETEDSAKTFVATKRESLTVTGSYCSTGGKRLPEQPCSKVVITGLEDPDSLLNFHFLDDDDKGIVYIAERTTTVGGRHRLLGWAKEDRGKFGKVQIKENDASGCSINKVFKVFCTAIGKEEGIVNSGMFP